MYEQRAAEIVRVVPPAYGEDGRLDVPQVRTHTPRRPERIVSSVIHHVVPEGRSTLEVQSVRVRQRSHIHEERVDVVGTEVESCRTLRRRLWPRAAARHEEVERARQQ